MSLCTKAPWTRGFEATEMFSRSSEGQKSKHCGPPGPQSPGALGEGPSCLLRPRASLACGASASIVTGPPPLRVSSSCASETDEDVRSGATQTIQGDLPVGFLIDACLRRSISSVRSNAQVPGVWLCTGPSGVPFNPQLPQGNTAPAVDRRGLRAAPHHRGGGVFPSAAPGLAPGPSEERKLQPGTVLPAQKPMVTAARAQDRHQGRGLRVCRHRAGSGGSERPAGGPVETGRPPPAARRPSVAWRAQAQHPRSSQPFLAKLCSPTSATNLPETTQYLSHCFLAQQSDVCMEKYRQLHTSWWCNI